MGTNNLRALHETELLDLIKTVLEPVADVIDSGKNRASSDIRYASSLSKATSAMTLVFPVLVSDTLDIKTASLVSKAIERNCVSMMQIALSAFGMSNAGNVVEFLKGFHTNVNAKTMDLDDYMAAANAVANGSFGEASHIIDYRLVAAINEDCRKNLNYVLGDDTSDATLENFIINRIGLTDVVTEAKGKANKPKKKGKDDTGSVADKLKAATKGFDIPADNGNGGGTKKPKPAPVDKPKKDDPPKDVPKKDDPKPAPAAEPKKANPNPPKDAPKKEEDPKKKMEIDTSMEGIGTAKMVSSDTKKANELAPSLLQVRIMLKDPSEGKMQVRDAVIGIKSKLYSADSNSICNRIISKHVDKNILLSLVKVGTRETSFFRDFLFAIDKAQIDALSKHKRGSANKLFKVLERRALGGKIRKTLGMANTCKPIFSLVISKEEADWLYSNKDVDVMNENVVIPIMEALNLMYFCVVDSTNEVVSFLLDGEATYEELSFGSLEKEMNDKQFNQMVNLVSQINR